MSHQAVFLDRDGTINIDPGYIGKPELVELFSDVPEGIAELKRLNFKLVVISNQSGIARGYFKAENVEAVNARINELLGEYGLGIDAFYYCPFHPDFNTPEECECRKPSPMLVFLAAKEMDIDLSRSYFAGDMVSDVECGINAGLKSILINRDQNQETISNLNSAGKMPTFIADNFVDACKFITQDFIGGN